MGFEENQPQPQQQQQVILVPYPMANQQFAQMPTTPINPQYVPVPVAAPQQQFEEPIKPNANVTVQAPTESNLYGRYLGWILLVEIIMTIGCAYWWLLSFWFAATFFLTVVWYGTYICDCRIAFLSALIFNGITSSYIGLMFLNLFLSNYSFERYDLIFTFMGTGISILGAISSYHGYRHAANMPNYQRASLFVFITLIGSALLGVATFLITRCPVSLIFTVISAILFFFVAYSPSLGHKISIVFHGLQLALSLFGMFTILSNHWFNFMNGAMGLYAISATLSLAGLLTSLTCAKMDRMGMADEGHAARAQFSVFLLLNFVEAAFTVFVAISYGLPMWFLATGFIVIASIVSVRGCKLATLSLLIFNVVAAGITGWQTFSLWQYSYYYTILDLFSWSCGCFLAVIMSIICFFIFVRQRRCSAVVPTATADA